MPAYTYYLYHIPSGRKYYGVQYKKNANPATLWKTYFSSSKIVKALVKKDGKDSFVVEVRKTFNNRLDALHHEQEVLRRLHVSTREDWINIHCYGEDWHHSKPHSEETKRKISRARTGQSHGPHSEETKRKIGNAHRGRTKTAEHKRRISESKRGCKMPLDSLWKWHRPLTEEHKRRISESLKGKKRGPYKNSSEKQKERYAKSHRS